MLAGNMAGDREAEVDLGPNGSGGGTSYAHSQVHKGGKGGRGGAVKSNSEGGGIMQLSQALRDHVKMLETRPEGTRGGAY